MSASSTLTASHLVTVFGSGKQQPRNEVRAESASGKTATDSFRYEVWQVGGPYQYRGRAGLELRGGRNHTSTTQP